MTDEKKESAAAGRSGADQASGEQHPIVKLRYVVLVLFGLLCLWLIPGIGNIQNDDDVLAFLPPDHPEVINFHEVADKFGMMEIGLIGLAPEGEGDMLTPDRVETVRALGQRLGEMPGVRIVLTYADLPNPEVTEDGLVVAALVPPDMSDEAQIRERVLGSRDAVGNLIAADGKAAAVMVFLLPRDGEGADAFARRRAELEDIKAEVRDRWDGEVHFGGAPFIEMAASEISRSDIEWLSPIVIAVLALASALLLRSVSAAVINLLITGLGVALIMGAHGRFDEPMTIVSSSIPVMMVALGGAFGMHVLAGYQRQRGSSPDRASATVRELWLPVVLSGATTSVAFFALVVMPQAPMQRFGVVAGIGVLLLLTLALFVLPALLAVLPQGMLATRDELGVPLPPRPPLWVLVVLALAGAGLTTQLRADPDTANVFSERAAPSRANAFFEEHFGGSVYLQVTVEGSLKEAQVLRTIRDLTDEVRQIEGVVDTRSIVEPVEVLNAALGGRRGIPENSARAGRVLTYLIGHPAMAQLMVGEGEGGMIHIKLGGLDGPEQVAVAEQVRAIVARHDHALKVAPSSVEAAAKQQRQDVADHLARLTGKAVDLSMLDPDAPVPPSKAYLEKVTELRDEVFDDEEGAVAVEVPKAELEALEPKMLLEPRGKKLEALIRKHMPTLVAEDPEGVEFAAEHLGAWIDEAKGKFRVDGYCETLGFAERCDELKPALAELDDAAWALPVDAAAPTGVEVVDVPLDLRLTGQPVIGKAFGESVTDSLWKSTLVSLGALALVLLVSRQLFALLPAVWTLAVTGGILWALGFPISVGTSMISCIALGAGVDFAIHLGFRARTLEGVDRGTRAVAQIGGVVLVSAVQLALAFTVLAASSMPPLQQLGLGLAVGLVGAALGAIWLTPALMDGRANSRASSTSGQDAAAPGHGADASPGDTRHT